MENWVRAGQIVIWGERKPGVKDLRKQKIVDWEVEEWDLGEEVSRLWLSPGMGRASPQSRGGMREYRQRALKELLVDLFIWGGDLEGDR
jgi:hypothetical protein